MRAAEMVVVNLGTVEAVGQHAELPATNETDTGLQFTEVEAPSRPIWPSPS